MGVASSRCRGGAFLLEAEAPLYQGWGLLPAGGGASSSARALTVGMSSIWSYIKVESSSDSPLRAAQASDVTT